MAMINCFGGLIGWVIVVIEEQWSRLCLSMNVEDNWRGAAEEVLGASVVDVIDVVLLWR